MPAGAPAAVEAPSTGVWRVGRGANPLALTESIGDLVATTAGNRFDSETGDFGVLYFGSSLEVCFGETLARLRPSTHLLATIADEWRELHFMEVGGVPADWRHRRSAVRVAFSEGARFVDIESPTTHAYLRQELAPGLAALGYADLDVGVVRGEDRRVTRLVANWAYRQVNEVSETLFAGIRYLSRLNNDWECWAIFDDVELDVIETIPITLDMPDLQRVAALFNLTLH